MTALGLGAVLGTGLFCIWWSCWPRTRSRPPRPAAAGRLRGLLQQAGLAEVAPSALVAASAVCGLVVLLATEVVSRAAPVAGCFAVMATAAPLAAVRARARRRRADLRQVWPDVVDHLASAVRAGLSLPEALSALGGRGPVELRAPFAAFAVDYRASGRFDTALDQLKERLADPVGDRVVESLRLARQVGGSDLGRLLRTLSAFLRADARTRGELESRQGWTVNAARLAVAAPWIVLMLLATRPESVAAYSRPAGLLVLLAGAGVTAASFLLMLRIARLPEERRVLR